MTEPVAYLNKYLDGSTDITRFKPINEADVVILSSNVIVSSKKLYTVEQLHPRVKMTQAEFDEFKKLLSVSISTIYEALDVINSDRGEMDEFEQLYNRLFTNGVNEQVKQQNEFATLWANYNPDNPDETIEIVPTMKWFVRSKERNSDNNYYYFVGKRPTDYWQNYGYRMAAKQFDTKEEAEKWTNPLTEAVQLAVEDE